MANIAPAPVLIPQDNDQKTIIDKTADFVARNGPAFEHKILINESQNPVFGFLKPMDPYHSYYKKRIEDIKGILPGAKPKAPAFPTTFPEKKTVETKEAKPVQIRRPEPERWIVEIPNITALDLEIIKLVAQFVARNGKQFQLGLMNREARNQQFDFLKTQHHLHRFFNQMVEAYSKILLPPITLKQEMERKYGSKQKILERIKNRVEWERQQQKLKEQEDEEEKEREERALIDWHDFVIVETITFDEDRRKPKPKPAPKPKEEAVDMDMEIDMDMDMEEEQEIKIKRDTQVAPQPETRTFKFQVCPKCGEEIPIDEMEEHMKIELLDPVSRRKRLEQMRKKRESTLAEDSDIAKNLKMLSQYRSDIFGSRGEAPIGEKVGKEGPEEQAKPDRVIWDGHTSSIGITANAVMSSMNKQQKPEDTEQPKIGATMPKGMTPTSQPTIPKVMPSPVMMQPIPPRQPMMPMMPMPPMMAMPPAMPMMPMMGMPPPMMPLPPGARPMPGMHPAPLATGQPPTKKARLDRKQLQDEEEFIKAHPGNVKLQITVPNTQAGNPEWRLDGQVLSLDVDIKTTIKQLKTKLSGLLGSMPVNKQKLELESVGFLNDKHSLGYYNILDGAT
eukprot:CAMPEP_0174261986 /NCGR_PEP_ID=MMETSP0439-20130205/12706_1 /TAXON_ID=0 /ORGANISM="Stereomyxa ramosa, Strain Chinc5" /LENGTH=617 /DNA_ID=CAMNT_0015346611 /DNA_START=1 /DNA_END=1850 /DNA_ORIENTATION=+